MIGYVCKQCPLAFEVGWYVYWDLSGGCVKYVCRCCGTMHKIEHLHRQPDMLYAAPGPVRAMVEEPFGSVNGATCTWLRLPITEESWRLIGPLPTDSKYLQGNFVLPHRAQAVSFDRLACVHCNGLGGLMSLDWPLSEAGTSPAFGDSCPVCVGPLEWVYDATIN